MPTREEIDELVDWMRERGVVRYADAEIEIVIDPHVRPKLVRPAPALTRDQQQEAKLVDEADNGEERQKQEHERFWKRVTRSSGAPIPPFKAKAS